MKAPQSDLPFRRRAFEEPALHYDTPYIFFLSGSDIRNVGKKGQKIEKK
jgi:hypothetical protein